MAFVECMVVDVLDLTSLQKRGLLKIPREEESTPDVIDLTLRTTATPNASASAMSATSDSSSAFDFLSGFAQLGAQESSVNTASSQTTHSSISSGHGEVVGKLDTILSKIEDTMYKIEVLSGRVAQLESRLGQ